MPLLFSITLVSLEGVLEDGQDEVNHLGVSQFKAVKAPYPRASRTCINAGKDAVMLIYF